MFIEVTELKTLQSKLINIDYIILIMPLALERGSTIVVKDFQKLDVIESYSTLINMIKAVSGDTA